MEWCKFKNWIDNNFEIDLYILQTRKRKKRELWTFLKLEGFLIEKTYGLFSNYYNYPMPVLISLD